MFSLHLSPCAFALYLQDREAALKHLYPSWDPAQTCSQCKTWEIKINFLLSLHLAFL